MPRMMEFRAPGVNYGNILQQQGQIKGQRLRNVLTERQLQREPETWELQKAQAKQGLKRGEQGIRKEDMVYQLEKLQTLSNLLRGVTDTSSYQAAIDQYIRTFPDEIGDLKYLPKDYHKPFVDNLIKATETAQERAAKIGFAGRQVGAAASVRSAELGLEGRRTAAAATVESAKIRAGAKKEEAEKLPPEVKWATDIIKKFSPKSMDPMIASLIETMNPGIVAQLQQQGSQVPPNIKPIYDKAVAILAEYTGANVTPPDIDPAGPSPIETFTENAPTGQVPAPAPAPAGQEFTHYATNPETGQKVGWDGTKWVPIQ